MTNNIEYRNELCREFIKTEEDWLLRSENMASIKKARKEKERKEELHKRNVEFLLSLAVAFVMIATAIGMVIGAFSIASPKNMEYYESKYTVVYETHIVTEGETLNGITKDILSDHPNLVNKVGRWNYDDLLIEVNNLDNPNKIYPGQEIVYPVF